jgi:chromosome condensin MukBEF MukE localization factor
MLDTILENGGTITTSELYEKLGAKMNLAKHLYHSPTRSTGEGTEPQWNNSVRQVVRHLKLDGKLVGVGRGRDSLP